MANWRSSREYRIWRMLVIRRDSRCVICNSLQKRNAHHINHATYFVDQRFDVDNGVTLCYPCHMNFHNNFIRSYRTKCTRYEWENFKVLATYFKGTFTKA